MMTKNFITTSPKEPKVSDDLQLMTELTISVHQESATYWAEVSELPGCFASGDDLGELFEGLKEGIATYQPTDKRSVSRRPVSSGPPQPKREIRMLPETLGFALRKKTIRRRLEEEGLLQPGEPMPGETERRRFSLRSLFGKAKPRPRRFFLLNLHGRR